jgi:hypothetical protein
MHIHDLIFKEYSALLKVTATPGLSIFAQQPGNGREKYIQVPEKA